MSDENFAESERLLENSSRKISWKRWGPYLSERQWGTVREDYSAYGNAWEYFTHDMSRSRAYRWGEDGIAGISDKKQGLCFSVAMWNHNDSIIKERLFGLTGNEGNHGEDVKELYYYLDNTPTHSWMKMLYKYPQAPYPYLELVQINKERGKNWPEYELMDTGIFSNNEYFDVYVEYAKEAAEDICIKITAFNRSKKEAPLDLIPQLWFRNIWSWGDIVKKPSLKKGGERTVIANHTRLGTYYLYSESCDQLLFCDNDTNELRFYNLKNKGKYYKDGINEFITKKNKDAINPYNVGTKVGFLHKLLIPAQGSKTILLRLTKTAYAEPFKNIHLIFQKREQEANAFYENLQKDIHNDELKNIHRQALSGMLWTKQFYYLDLWRWLKGDPGQPPPPKPRRYGRNSEWTHLYNEEIISMPDKWEYPWYAAWDLGFQCLPLSLVDVDFAKEQLLLITREWYMHPNGQLPAYEWAFGDVNPPVHAWAAWRVYQIDKKYHAGVSDLAFLEKIFHKLMINFTWWVNKKDAEGRNLFQGGFLGLDNIGVFDRSAPLPKEGYINQADGTSWMAMFALNLLRISLELALYKPSYEDIASKFFEHFLFIAHAMTNMAGIEHGLWNEEDEFYYDVLKLPNEPPVPLKIRSIVGLIPLFAVEVLDSDTLEKLPEFHKRMKWLLNHRPDLTELISHWEIPGIGEKRLLSLLRGHRMKCLLKRMLDEKEFLSEYGIRALSKYHLEQPYEMKIDGNPYYVNYQPAESDTTMFGGNSNWRGPIWLPINYLIIESLQKFHHYYGDDFKVECPTGSGNYLNLLEISEELTRRLIRLFTTDEKGKRAIYGTNEMMQNDPFFKDNILFYEYFDGDTGRGAGASHQTGWTGLIAKLIQPRTNRSAKQTEFLDFPRNKP